MKKLLLLLTTIALLACKGEEKKESLYPTATDEPVAEGATSNLTPSEKLGQKIFDGKGNCFSCHKPDQKVIGPSVVEIAKIYKEKNADMVAFLKEEGDPIVDPANYSAMKINLILTKTFTDEELKGLEDYFYSHLKK